MSAGMQTNHVTTPRTKGILRDLLVMLIFCLGVFALASNFELFETLSQWAEEHEAWQVDELITTSIALVFALAVFSLRRWSELQGEVLRRREAEAASQEANRHLGEWVHELEQRNREINLFNEMGDLLQACKNADEAYLIIARSAQELFPGDSGALYVLSPSRDVVESVARWGEGLNSELVFPLDDCWALRRGRIHQVRDASKEPICQHIAKHELFGLPHSPSPQLSYLCVPMVAQGDAFGVLYLQSNLSAVDAGGPGGEEPEQSKRTLAMTMAEHLALALSNLRLRETLRLQSIRDPLTGLFNRRYMEESLEREIRRASRNGGSLGVIMLDVDHFKQFNDTFGHGAGDTLLRELSTLFKSRIRGGDIACRYGGEEFALILPDASLNDTRLRAEHLREEAAHLDVQYRGQVLRNVTLSLGVAAFPEHESHSDALLQAADAALYRAKAEGRDRVVIAEARG